MIDKYKVARSFSRSAATYDQVAHLQCDVGQQLLDDLSSFLNTLPKWYANKNTFSDNDNRNAGNACLDLGCGTGFFKSQLEALSYTQHYIGLDIAEGMLRYAVATSETPTTSSWLCADAEFLPLTDNCIDCVFSNMALQWCENLPQLFSELHRISRPNAIMALTTLGPQTLYELKQAWLHVDEHVHVNEFIDDLIWQAEIENNGFIIEKKNNQLIELQYTSVMHLLKELKCLGAHNINAGQPIGLTLPKHLQIVLDAYARDETNTFYPATYEVTYWIIRRGTFND